MTKRELIKRIEKLLKDHTLQDSTWDPFNSPNLDLYYKRGHVDACKTILKLAKNLNEEDCAFTE